MRKQKNDPINHPKHYTSGPIETIDFIQQTVEAYPSTDGYNAGCVLKYLARAPLKGDFVQDLQKAKWYLDDLLANYVDLDTGKIFKKRQDA